jgi:transcription elongation factor GreA
VPGRAVASTGGTRRTAPASTSARAGRSTAATSTRPRVTKAAPVAKAPPAPTHVTAAGLVALERELDELVNLRRPEVIARVKHARELGDLRENADYEAARNEQSFLEGRVRALEQLIKTAQVIDTDHTGEVMLGSTVVAEVEGEPATLHIVGSTEADPANGRISNASPVGKALLGHRAGDEIVIQTPGHELHYRIVEVRQLDR